MADLVPAAGRAVARPLVALTRLRRAKPMHPYGVLFRARFERTGPAAPWGVDWIDRPGQQEALVRLSRGAGLPGPLPDVLGMALRLPDGGPGGRPVDLLLSTTGRGRLTRLVPVPRRDAGATYGSIMAYRTPVGPVAFAAWARPGRLPSDRATLAARAPGTVFTLAAALDRGPWEPFARVVLGAPPEPVDPPMHFDAVLDHPPGLVPDGPIARFRRPAYAAVRAEQQHGDPAPSGR
ncbi:phosphodiesterase [Modestobacter sp. SYSU DS0290]